MDDEVISFSLVPGFDFAQGVYGVAEMAVSGCGYVECILAFCGICKMMDIRETRLFLV